MGGTHYTITQSKALGFSIDISAAGHADSGEFLDQIIAGEEMWVAQITPEHRAKCMELALIFLAYHVDSDEVLDPIIAGEETWVAHISPEHKAKRIGVSIDISAAYNVESDEFLDQTIEGEETWVAHIIPEHKAKSMELAMIFLQHVMLTVANFWTRSSPGMKRGWHILHQNTKQNARSQH